MARIVPRFNIQYVDYRVVDVRGCGDGAWRTIIAFKDEKEAREAAKVLKYKLGFRVKLLVHRNIVVISKYIMEWKIAKMLSGE